MIPVDDGESCGLLALVEHLTTRDNRFRQLAVLGSFGVSASVYERTVVRFEYSCAMNYLDEPLAGAIEFGVGYRF